MTTRLAEDLSRVLDFLDEEMAGAADPGSEQRDEPRRAQTLVVEMVPLDDTLRPVGEMGLGVSRDISRHGASVFAEIPPGAKYARVRFPIRNGGRVEVLMRIAWCREVGRMSEFGGPVVAAGEMATAGRGDAPSALVPLQP